MHLPVTPEERETYLLSRIRDILIEILTDDTASQILKDNAARRLKLYNLPLLGPIYR